MRSVEREPLPWDLLTNLTLRQIRTSYKQSVLGFGWSMLNPLISIAVYALIFQVVLPVEAPPGSPSGIDNYGFFLVSGVLGWQFNVGAMMGQMASLTSSRPLIEKTYFPRWVLPASTLAARTWTYLIELAVLLVLLLVVFQELAVLYAPVLLGVIGLQLVFVFGLGQVLAIFNARFRDTEHLVGLWTQIWFWLTPIIYPLSRVENAEASFMGVDLATIYKLNPMLWFVRAYRDLLYDVRLPTAVTWAAMAVWAVLMGAVGTYYFHRQQATIAERL